MDARPFYTQRVGYVFVSYVVPRWRFLGAAIVRWKYRAFFITLLFLAVVIAVGAAPYSNPSLLGGIYKNLSLNREAVFAFRNVGRVMPLLSVSVGGDPRRGGDRVRAPDRATCSVPRSDSLLPSSCS